MSDKREAIRKAEEQVENILEGLERQHDVRVYQVYVNSNRGETPQINLVSDKRGGSL